MKIRMYLILFACCLFPLVNGNAEDFPGGGEEAEAGYLPEGASGNGAKQADSGLPVLTPANGGTAFVAPSRRTNPDVKAGAVEQGVGPIRKLELDLTADLPGSEPVRKRGPFWVKYKDITIEGLMSESSKSALDLLALMKKQVYQISDDLDGGGKQRTRLIFTTDALGGSIGKILDLWSRDEDFRDVCRISKSRVLALEEELRAQPRNWKHVRWAFSAVQKEIKRLRLVTVSKIKGDPVPLRITKKDGTVVLIPAEDPILDAAIEADLRRARSEREKQRLRNKIEANKKSKDALRIGIDR